MVRRRCSLLGDADEVRETEARQMAHVIREETGLDPRTAHDGEGEWWLEVDLPPLGEELRATVQVNEADDWPWLYETHVRHRLNPPA
jgi:hypothetical protein